MGTEITVGSSIRYFVHEASHSGFIPGISIASPTEFKAARQGSPARAVIDGPNTVRDSNSGRRAVNPAGSLPNPVVNAKYPGSGTSYRLNQGGHVAGLIQEMGGNGPPPALGFYIDVHV